MLTQEDDVDAHALRRRGWSISAIARHLGHDRKTIRAYLNGDRAAGVRVPVGDDRFARFVDYCRERLGEDPHLWAVTLFDEVVELGFDQSYPSFTRQLRTRGLGIGQELSARWGGWPRSVAVWRSVRGSWVGSSSSSPSTWTRSNGGWWREVWPGCWVGGDRRWSRKRRV